MWILRPIARLLASAIDLVLPFPAVDDVWERLSIAAPPRAFGRGSLHDFRWYFEGESQVRAESIDAVCDWLLGCEYVGDPELFHEADFWQHPRTFERLRQGDCEDYALWAWRKLVELGIDAELVCGEWLVDDREDAGHAWVVFRDAGAEFVLEATARSRAAMVRPLAEVRAEYRPHAGVNGRFETTAFSGLLLSMKDKRARRRARKRPRPDADEPAP